MSILRNVVFVAALAGLVAGLVMAAMQSFATTPLILAAETFEVGVASHPHGEAGAASSGAAGHHHDEEAWAPADGFEREFYTAASNVVTAIGFALLLVVASELAGGIASLRQGIAWGFAGFAVFSLAPTLGLPPELPGMPAAEIAARQVWWIATVAATAAGLALVVFGRGAAWAVAGIVLVVLPHVVGAPQPEGHATEVPAALHRSFVVAVTVTSLVFWVVLGAGVAVARGKVMGAPAPAQGRLA